MMIRTAMSVMVIAAALGACGSTPPVPSWKSNAHGALAAFSDAYLRGDSGIAEREFASARAEMASTGRPDLVAHAELVRCATRVASLEYDECPGFSALAQDASAAERAYAAYLAGRWQGIDAALLPVQHRAVVGPGPAGKSVLSAIEDPLSRLVAAGALLKAERLAPADIAVATETASSQGWRRPLLMWLGISAKRARDAGDSTEAERIQRRIDVAGAVGQ